jgi:uncharacterized protein
MKTSTRLFLAAANGDIETAVQLLDSGADPNALAYGRTPLMRAVEKRQLGTAILLLDRGADQTIRSKGLTPLHVAAMKGPGAMVRALIDAGADPEARGPADETPLMLAAQSGPIEAARALLDYPIDLEARGRHGFTALCGALRYPPRPTLVRLLLDRGADVNARTDHPRWGRVGGLWTPLSLALSAVATAESAAPHLVAGEADLRRARAVVAMLRDAGATE